MAAASETPRGPAPVGFYVHDAVSSRMMLIDTGAMQSVFLPSREDHRCLPDPLPPDSRQQVPILSYGTRLLSFSILGRKCEWDFIVTDVRTPLLGVDFLAHFRLVVEVGSKCLLDTEPCQSLPLSPGPQGAHNLFRCSPPVILKEFPEVFKPELHQVPGPCKHGIYHHIKTRTPTHAKFQRLPP
ncbi:uncharacterized protein [Macrobrachium rosenbergii]|uniref:uncharacterized protein n=1 Tax=Macrobrachium rosenbergii TaxID=79674 RepID=UPI0034D56AA9